MRTVPIEAVRSGPARCGARSTEMPTDGKGDRTNWAKGMRGMRGQNRIDTGRLLVDDAR